MKLTRILEFFDSFGYGVFFSINGKEKFRSSAGGFGTIIMFLLFFIYAAINFVSFIKREHLTSTYAETYLTQSPEVNFNSSSFSLAVNLVYNDDSSPADEDFKDYLKMDFIHRHNIRSQSDPGQFQTISTTLQKNKCNFSDFQGISEEMFRDNSLQIYSCPDFKNLSLTGFNTEDVFSYMTLKVSLLESAFQDMDKLYNKLLQTPIKLFLIYKDTALDLNNYGNPVQKYLIFQSIWIDLSMKKMENFRISELEFSSDENYFLESPKKYNLIKKDQSEPTSISFKDRSQTKISRYRNVLVDVYFEISRKKIFWSRSYMKISNYLADMLSIMNTLIFIFSILFKYINEIGGNLSILNKTTISRENNLTELYEKVHKLNRNSKSFNFENSKNRDFFEKETIINKKYEKYQTEKFEIKNNENLDHPQRPLEIYVPTETDLITQNRDNLEKVKNLENIENIENIEKPAEIFTKLKNPFATPTKQHENVPQKSRKSVIPFMDRTKLKKQMTSRVAGLSFTSYIDAGICPCRKENRIRSKFVTNELGTYLDIVSYIRVLNEFEYIKKLIFSGSPNFTKLLDFVARPLIKITKKSMKKILESDKADTETKQDEEEDDAVKNVINRIDKCYETQDKTEYQNILLTDFDHKIETIFSNFFS
jgi:hypothetical protein